MLGGYTVVLFYADSAPRERSPQRQTYLRQSPHPYSSQLGHTDSVNPEPFKQWRVPPLRGHDGMPHCLHHLEMVDELTRMAASAFRMLPR